MTYQASREQMFVILHLIGWRDSMSFLDQSQSEVKQNLSNPGPLSMLNWKLLYAQFSCRIFFISQKDKRNLSILYNSSEVYV